MLRYSSKAPKVEKASMNGRLPGLIFLTSFTCIVLCRFSSRNTATACRLLDGVALGMLLPSSDSEGMLWNSSSSSFRFLTRNSKFVSSGNRPSSSSSSESARSSSRRNPSGFHVRVLRSTLSGFSKYFVVDPSSKILS